MSARLYVGDLPFSATDEGIRALFESVGVAITSISITRDRMTGQSRGFGFVDVADQALAQQAIDALHGRSFEGRNLIVNVAQERAPQVISAGGGGYGSGESTGLGRGGGTSTALDGDDNTSTALGGRRGGRGSKDRL